MNIAILVAMIGVATALTVAELYKSGRGRDGDLFLSFPSALLWFILTLAIFGLSTTTVHNQLDNTASFQENVIAGNGQVENVTVYNYTVREVETTMIGSWKIAIFFLAMGFVMSIETARVYLRMASGLQKQVKEVQKGNEQTRGQGAR